MANLTTIEPIRYAQSSLSQGVSGLLMTKFGLGLALVGIKSVDGFEISGVQPAGTERRAVFQLEGVWYRLNPDGSLDELMQQVITADNVLYYGNNMNELAAITSIPLFLGKEIGVAVALSAPSPDAAMPTLKLGVKGTTAVPIKALNILSPVYTVAPESLIFSLDVQTETANGGTVVVEGQIADPDGNLQPWAPLSVIQGKRISSVQFRATLTAPQLGVSLAKLSQISMRYRSGDDVISGAGTAELISITQDWHRSVEGCRMTVRHPPLVDAQLFAACAIRDKTSVITGESLGVGTGERATYTLAHIDGIQFSSVAIYVNGTRIIAGWELNTEVGRITLTAPLGAMITADYIHGWTEEVWQPLQNGGTVRTPDYDETEFRLLAPETGTDKSICAIKIGLTVTEAHQVGESVGVGTGHARAYPLAHAVKEGAIRVYAGGTELPPGSWRLLEGEKTLEVAAEPGVVLTADYDWISETPKVNKFIAVFA